MDKHIIAGVHIEDRERHAPNVQEVFTKYGLHIKTRLGLHDDVCSSNGLILLEIADTPEAFTMLDEIGAIEGVDCKKMIFEH